MIKRWLLKQVIKSIIKKMPKYKAEASELIKNNTDDVLDKIEEVIKTALEKLIAKKANK